MRLQNGVSDSFQRVAPILASSAIDGALGGKPRLRVPLHHDSVSVGIIGGLPRDDVALPDDDLAR